MENGEGMKKWEDRKKFSFLSYAFGWEDGKLERWKTIEKKSTIIFLLN